MSRIQDSLMYRAIEKKFLDTIIIEKSLDSVNYPYKVIDDKSCTWRLDYHNLFTIDGEYLTGVIGDFRSGGPIQRKKISDVIGWDFKETDGNSIFLYTSNKEVAESVKQDMLYYISKKLATIK